MDALKLIDIISLGETSTVQFKRTVENNTKLAAEMCAFANSEGGMILFGIEDDQTISGLDAASIRDLNSRIANVATNNIREPIFPTSEVVKIGEHYVLIVKIVESQSKPHFDLNGAIWVKNMGDKRRVTSREELRRIFQDAHVFFADEQPISRSTLGDLDMNSFCEFYNNEYNSDLTINDIEPSVLESLNIAHASNLTLAGLLFYAKTPQKYRPELITKAVAFSNNEATSTSYTDSEDIDGTLPQQLAKTIAFIKRNLLHIQGDQSFNSTGTLEIPEQVLEELLVNMLIHRNYFISAPHKVFIHPNRIELISPGTLTNSLTVEQIKAGNSIPRNPILHSLASRILPYKGIGTGIRRALSLYPHIDLLNDTPNNRFVVTLQRQKTQ